MGLPVVQHNFVQVLLTASQPRVEISMVGPGDKLVFLSPPLYAHMTEDAGNRLRAMVDEMQFYALQFSAMSSKSLAFYDRNT